MLRIHQHTRQTLYPQETSFLEGETEKQINKYLYKCYTEINTILKYSRVKDAMLETLVQDSHSEKVIFEQKKEQNEPQEGFHLTNTNISSKGGRDNKHITRQF